jgi:hypothetical protein
MSNKILPEEIGINNYVNGTIKNYHKDKIPTPPVHHFKHAAHYWIANIDCDRRISNVRVLQWAPVERKWYMSGDVATCIPAVLNMEGAILLTHVEVPDFPFELPT